MLQEAELSEQADSENDFGGSSETMYYIALDVHKKTISFCVKDATGCVQQECKMGSTRRDLPLTYAVRLLEGVWNGDLVVPKRPTESLEL